MKIGLLAYDFPHAKTNNFIVALQSLGHDIDCILAAPWRKLQLPKLYGRTAVKREIAIHPRRIAQSYKIPYYSVVHNSKECIKIIKDRQLDLGIIGGARILKNKVIKAFKKGIINFHGALIPENRGLDIFKWAVYLDLPLAITAHFIDYRVDAGRIIKVQRYPVYLDDTVYDLEQRASDTVILMMGEIMKLAIENPVMHFELIGEDIGEFRTIMTEDVALEAIRRFPDYRKKWACDGK